MKIFKKMIPKNEFRFNFSTQHFCYIFGEINNKYLAVGLTHEEYTFFKKICRFNKIRSIIKLTKLLFVTVLLVTEKVLLVNL